MTYETEVVASLGPSCVNGVDEQLCKTAGGTEPCEESEEPEHGSSEARPLCTSRRHLAVQVGQNTG